VFDLVQPVRTTGGCSAGDGRTVRQGRFLGRYALT
jgi:hypothetical protein